MALLKILLLPKFTNGGKKLNNATQPKHYNHGKVDLFETWYLKYQFQEFRCVMKSHIDKYVSRYEYKNGLEDLEKAKECINRLIEYEKRERNGNEKTDTNI